MKRLSALIILLANLMILVHSAIPHYHGDDMIATICHIAGDADNETAGHHCHHDGDASHDTGHCIINDSMMALACRADHEEAKFAPDFVALPVILECIFESITESKPLILNADNRIPVIKGPCIEALGLRAPPALLG